MAVSAVPPPIYATIYNPKTFEERILKCNDISEAYEALDADTYISKVNGIYYDSPSIYAISCWDSSGTVRSTNSKAVSKAMESYEYAMRKAFTDYYSGGDTTIDGIKQMFQDSAKKIRQMLIDGDNTTMDNERDNRLILTGMYNRFNSHCIFGARQVSQKDGKEFADNDVTNFIYYDAKYYFQSEEIKDLGKQWYSELEQEFNLEAEAPPHYETNYNSAIFGSGEFHAKMFDKTMVPPKDFVFYSADQQFPLTDYYDSGTQYVIEASTQEDIVAWYLTVPRGFNLFKDGVNLDVPTERVFENGRFVQRIYPERYLAKYAGKGKNAYDKVIAFYEEYCNNFEAGIVMAGIGKNIKKAEAPFKMITADHVTISAFNAGSLISAEEGEMENSDEFNKFMANIQVVSNWYRYNPKYQIEKKYEQSSYV